MAEGYKAYTKEFSKTNNEFPLAFTNKIVNAESLSVLKQLPDNCVDLVFTSPPYNFGMGLIPTTTKQIGQNILKCFGPYLTSAYVWSNTVVGSLSIPNPCSVNIFPVIILFLKDLWKED